MCRLWKHCWKGFRLWFWKKLGVFKMIETKSKITYPYETIKITKSRIDKGLLAIPKSLSHFFPNHNSKIKIYLEDSNDYQIKNFSSSTSRTKENRIGGLANWFKKSQIKKDDEIVIQFIDKKNYIYRLITENKFINKTKAIQKSYNITRAEIEVIKRLEELSDWTQKKQREVVLYEYARLVNEMPFIERKRRLKSHLKTKETAPNNIRILLEKLYNGHCQICDFHFLKINKKPYYEIHHINPLKGHHPKNIVLVCANCHKQFEFSNVVKIINQTGWLIGVKFNNTYYELNNFLLKKEPKSIKKIHI